MGFFLLFFVGMFLFVFDFFYCFFFVGLVSVVLLSYMGGVNFFGYFFLDNLSFLLVFLSLLLFLFCVFSSFSDFWGSNFFFSFGGVLWLIFFLLFLSFLTFSVLGFYVCFEFVFILMFYFLLSWGYSPERLQASIYMIFYTIVVSLPFLVYLVFLGIFLEVKFIFWGLFSGFWWLSFFFVFLVKLPVYGVHLWLPKAHVEAPVSGSMLLAGVLLKLGGYGLIRSFCLFLEVFSFVKSFFIGLGVLGGLFSCFLCLRQGDLKAFVAYSSVCHMGMCLGGLVSGSVVGLVGGMWMMIGHGFCSSCLFYVLYVYYDRYFSRSFLILKGIGSFMPLMGLVWFLFSVINMGVPPFISFFSEVFILFGVAGINFFSVPFIMFLFFFAGVYGIFLYTVIFHGVEFLEGMGFFLSVREFLNFYGHFYFLGFFIFCLGIFFL